MKNINSALLTLLLIAVVGYGVWQHQITQAYRQQSSASLVQLSLRLDSIEAQMAAAKDELQKIDDNSVSGIIDNANEVLINGWSAMMRVVENELEKARDAFEKESNKSAP
ncbi:MAG: hypothetical protein ACSHWQ_07960 [Spongiibacteraceae bacterium]